MYACFQAGCVLCGKYRMRLVLLACGGMTRATVPLTRLVLPHFVQCISIRIEPEVNCLSFVLHSYLIWFVVGSQS